MEPGEAAGSEARFWAYVERLSKALGHRDRDGPFRAYCSGLLGTEGRKSVEPLAAATAPSRVSGQHQSLLHFVGQSEWSDAAVLAEVRAYVLPAIERGGSIEAWILDDTSFPKQGRHSVGVARQYAGSSASRPTARPRGRFRSPIITPACQSAIASTCRRNGSRTSRAASRRGFPTMLFSRLRRRSRSACSSRPWRKARRADLCWRTRATGPIRPFARP